MTLVQASISNHGNTVIMIADRLLTNSFGEDFPSYEFESNSPKIFSRNDVGIGFAGGAIYADMAMSQLPEDILDIDEIVQKISLFVKTTRSSLIDDEVFKFTRKKADDFFSNPEGVPDDIINLIYGWMGNVLQSQFQFQCIVAGFDNKEKSKIVSIENDGNTYDITNFGMGSIGSGLVFSQIYFDQHQYKISMPENESLFFAFKAKKWAQAHTGVGLKTDILLFRNNGKNIEIQHEFPLMDKINKLYNKERERNDTIKHELLTKFVESNKETFNET